MTPAQTIADLTRHIRAAVRPHLGAWHGRAIEGVAASGDATFAIDQIAEAAVVEFIERNNLHVALYSEDKGLVEFGSSPEAVLVIDPIDGTRPAVAGFESCVVSVAWADYVAAPTLGDVRHACVQELKGADMFLATRGEGAQWLRDGEMPAPHRLLPMRDIRSAPLSFECVARPFALLGQVLGEIVDAAAMRGGCFLFNSTAYSLTRLVSGQLAGVLDVGARIFADRPVARARFVELGGGKPVALFTYDIAAAALIASEAGAVVTDASGRDLASTPLLDTSEGNLVSLIAASNPALHAALLAAVNAGMTRLEIN